MDRYLRPLQPTASTPASAKMAPARNTAEVPSETNPPLQMADEHNMPPFSPPSDLSPCLPRSLEASPDRGDILCSPPLTASPSAPITSSALCFSPGDLEEQRQPPTHRNTVSTLHHVQQSQGLPLNAPSEQRLWAFLQQLPTRNDMESLAQRIESAMKGELQTIRQDVAVLDSRVTVVEQDQGIISQSVQTLQTSQSELTDQIIQLHLLQDDLENRSRRQNIRLRGVPESVPQSELRSTVANVFNRYLDRPPDSEIVIDRVHRTLGPRPDLSDRPRDVLCCLHSFTLKEDILQRAWRVGVLEFDGAAVHLLPDVSRLTLQMRRSLKPLLDGLGEKGLTYKWGHPFHLIVRKGPDTFSLRHPSELPNLFTFADMDPFPVPNWLLTTIAKDQLRQAPPGRSQRAHYSRRGRGNQPQARRGGNSRPHHPNEEVAG